MSRAWIGAWVVSAVMAAGAWWFARRGRLGAQESLLFASAFLPAPLFVAIGGSNSFVYAHDFVTLYALYLARDRWREASRPIKLTAQLIWYGAGLALFLACVIFDAERQDVLLTGINCYRLAGALAILVVLGAWRAPPDFDGRQVLNAFAWVNLVLVAAMVLQRLDVLNSNVFHMYQMGGEIKDYGQTQYIVAGMFRGSQGILGTLGIAAFAAQFGAGQSRSVFATVGGFAGLLVIVLSGSKTSLFAAAGVVAVRLVLFPITARRSAAVLAVIAAGVLFLAADPFGLAQDDRYVAITLDVFTGREESFATYWDRVNRRMLAFDLIDRDMTILLGSGMANTVVREVTAWYWHCEYITLVMLAGLWALGPYLAGLWVMGRHFVENRLQASEVGVFGALVLFSGVLQGISSSHLLPGILYTSSVAAFVCAYAFGLNPSCSLQRRDVAYAVAQTTARHRRQTW